MPGTPPRHILLGSLGILGLGVRICIKVVRIPGLGIMDWVIVMSISLGRARDTIVGRRLRVKMRALGIVLRISIVMSIIMSIGPFRGISVPTSIGPFRVVHHIVHRIHESDSPSGSTTPAGRRSTNPSVFLLVDSRYLCFVNGIPWEKDC